MSSNASSNPDPRIESMRRLLVKTPSGTRALAAIDAVETRIVFDAKIKTSTFSPFEQPPVLRLNPDLTVAAGVVRMAYQAPRAQWLAEKRIPNARASQRDVFAKAYFELQCAAAWSEACVALELFELVDLSEQAALLKLQSVQLYCRVTNQPKASAEALAAVLLKTPSERSQLETAWRQAYEDLTLKSTSAQAFELWDSAQKPSPAASSVATKKAPLSKEERAEKLETAKSLLARTRWGAKALVALNLSPLHLRLGKSELTGDTLVFPETETLAQLALRIGAAGTRIASPNATNDKIVQITLDIAADLSKRLEGDDRAVLEQIVRNSSLGFDVPVVFNHVQEITPLLPAADQTGLAARGYVYMGSFRIGPEMVVHSGSDRVSFAAHAGAWHAFARPFTPEDSSKGPEMTVGMLIACSAQQVAELDSRVQQAHGIGTLKVEGGVIALVDGTWSDRWPVDKWMKEVDAPIGRVRACQIGSHGCASESGYGDGAYEVRTFAAQGQPAECVVVEF